MRQYMHACERKRDIVRVRKRKRMSKCGSEIDRLYSRRFWIFNHFHEIIFLNDEFVLACCDVTMMGDGQMRATKSDWFKEMPFFNFANIVSRSTKKWHLCWDIFIEIEFNAFRMEWLVFVPFNVGTSWKSVQKQNEIVFSEFSVGIVLIGKQPNSKAKCTQIKDSRPAISTPIVSLWGGHI